MKNLNVSDENGRYEVNRTDLAELMRTFPIGNVSMERDWVGKDEHYIFFTYKSTLKGPKQVIFGRVSLQKKDSGLFVVDSKSRELTDYLNRLNLSL